MDKELYEHLLKLGGKCYSDGFAIAMADRDGFITEHVDLDI